MKKILIVEDNDFIMKLVMAFLDGIECEILQADNGEDAIKVAENNIPDIIYLDIQIPKIDGITVLKQLREKNDFKNTPIILMTAFAQDKDIQIGFESGCTQYLTKPFTRDRFLEILNTYI